jgi:hypothetical protein
MQVSKGGSIVMVTPVMPGPVNGVVTTTTELITFVSYQLPNMYVPVAPVMPARCV